MHTLVISIANHSPLVVEKAAEEETTVEAGGTQQQRQQQLSQRKQKAVKVATVLLDITNLIFKF